MTSQEIIKIYEDAIKEHRRQIERLKRLIREEKGIIDFTDYDG